MVGAFVNHYYYPIVRFVRFLQETILSQVILPDPSSVVPITTVVPWTGITHHYLPGWGPNLLRHTHTRIFRKAVAVERTKEKCKPYDTLLLLSPRCYFFLLFKGHRCLATTSSYGKTARPD